MRFEYLFKISFDKRVYPQTKGEIVAVNIQVGLSGRSVILDSIQFSVINIMLWFLVISWLVINYFEAEP